jgi:hypothetical protein
MFLRACINLIPSGPSQIAAATSVFRKCRESSQVTEMIVLILERPFSHSDLQQILGVDLKTEGASNFDCIPDAWKFKEKPQKKGRKINNRRQR